MAVIVHQDMIVVTLTPHDTWMWAHHPRHWWPGTTLAGRSITAMFDQVGLHTCEIGDDSAVDQREFWALMRAACAEVPENHPCMVHILHGGEL